MASYYTFVKGNVTPLPSKKTLSQFCMHSAEACMHNAVDARKRLQKTSKNTDVTTEKPSNVFAHVCMYAFA